jgi:phage N-6-adenine-methyltransferase
MNSLVLSNNNLPTAIEDLSKFVLVGREKLTAVRAEIRAIDKLDLAKEVREQKKQEAQLLGEALLDAEAKIGEMLKEIPKDNSFKGNQHKVVNSQQCENTKTKEQVTKELGFNKDMVSRFETLADNKEIIEQVKAEARENEEIPTRTAVLNKVQEIKRQEEKPHVFFNSGDNEWYTPNEYIELARKVMGSIDLDPASCEYANKVVNADKIFTINDNGLEQKWHGNVWLNPPYSSDLIRLFINKLSESYANSDISQAIVLVNNATETAWFNELISLASAVVFPRGRVKFYTPDGKTGAPLQGQAIVYIGDNDSFFLDKFCSLGWGALL